MFNHYVAVDWAMSNMAIAKMTDKSNKVTIIDVPSSLKELQFYLKKLNGKVIVVIEETTTSRWLYTELFNCVDKVFVCDPSRNALLSEGPKTDKIDAEKLVKLLKADFLKEIYHDNSKFIEIRKIVSGYEDLIKSGVRLKNQRSALFRAKNMNHKKERLLDSPIEEFVLSGLDTQILIYEDERKRYLGEFKRLRKQYKEIQRLTDIPGIGEIIAVKIVSRVVDAKRFKKRNQFLSYCGLVKHDRISGGKNYGRKNTRYSRMMKCALNTAFLTSLRGDGEFKHRYEYLMNEKNYSARDAKWEKI